MVMSYSKAMYVEFMDRQKKKKPAEAG